MTDDDPLSKENIEKAFNTLHAGFGVEDDQPPERFFLEPVQSGKYQGAKFDHREWNDMLEEYYVLHGWDAQTGLQTEAILADLGLYSVLERLRQEEKLS